MLKKEELAYAKYVTKVLGDMEKNHLGIDTISTLFVGEPGTGKTSFVKFFAKLVGLPLVLIEVPHISEEHLINIPFLVIDNNKNFSENEMLDSDFKLVRAKSVLTNILEKLSPYAEEEYMLQMEENVLLKDLYASHRERIRAIRKKFRCIMFFDEFYRARNVRIVNILRTFLNNKIGVDDIPEGVYTIYASNLNSVVDEGLNEIPLNHHFKTIVFDTPSLSDWYYYMETKHFSFLRAEVLEVFKKHISSDNIFSADVEAEVRISPRRLEEIVLYINQLYIMEGGLEQAKAFMKINSRNYLSKKVSSYYENLKSVAEDLFDKEGRTLNWIDILQNQIQIKEHLGVSRKYVPCLSGKPGVSKTSMVKKLGRDFGLNVIDIDCAPLNPEDTIGIPNIKSGNIQEEEVFFTEPLLYAIIMESYNKNKEMYKGKRYNHILFLDEINRTSPAVFNAIRKLILDKEVNEDYRLPEDIMVVAALNPTGEGTIELTPHLKDVLDIIHASPLFDNVLNYIEGFSFVKSLGERYGINGREYVKSFVNKLVSRFASQTDANGEDIQDFNERAFHLVTSDNNVIYISPREFTTIALNMLYDIGIFLESVGYSQYTRYSSGEYEDFENALKLMVFEILKSNLHFVCVKQGLEDIEIENTIKLYMNHLVVNEGEVFRLLENIYSDIEVGPLEMMKNVDFDLKRVVPKEFVFNLNNYVQRADSSEIVVNEMNDLLDYIVNSIDHGSYIKLYEYYLDFFLIIREADFEKDGNQLSDRISKVLLYNYEDISEKIKKEDDMFRIYEELDNSKVFEQSKYEKLFDKNDKATFALSGKQHA